MKEKKEIQKSRIIEIDTVEGKYPIEITSIEQNNKEKQNNQENKIKR